MQVVPFFFNILHGDFCRIQQVIVFFYRLFQLGDSRLLDTGLFRQRIKVVLQDGNPDELYDNQQQKDCRRAGEKLFRS